MGGLFRVSEIANAQLARAAYPLVHSAHHTMTFQSWMRRIRSAHKPEQDRRHHDKGYMAVMAERGTVLAVFTYCVQPKLQPESGARKAGGKILKLRDMAHCDVPGLDLPALMRAEAGRLAARFGCTDISPPAWG